MKRLIVNADDLGYSAGVDAGILRAYRDGIVTSTTLMTNVPGAMRAALLVRDAPRLDVGVHLVLTYGRPLSDPATVPSLVGSDGAFLRPRSVVGTGRIRTEEALREYRAQHARGRELLGRDPSHVDTHHWVEEDPDVREAFIALARDTGAAVRSITPAIRDLARAAGLRTTDRYRRDFQHRGHIDTAALLGILVSLEDGVTELGCHPGEPDAGLEAISSYARERPVELASIVDPAVRAKVDELGLVLSTFRDLR